MKKGRQGEGGGQPIKSLTDEQVIQVEALAGYLSLEQIADYMGVSRCTFNEIRKRQPEVELRYRRGRANTIGDVGTSLIQKARGGDTSSMVFYLKTQAGWKESKVTEHVVSDKKTLKSFYEELDDDDED